MTAGQQGSITEHLPLTLSVGQVAKLLQISRNLAYEAVRTGQIPSIRISTRILVPRAQLMKMLSDETTAPPMVRDITGKA